MCFKSCPSSLTTFRARCSVEAHKNVRQPVFYSLALCCNLGVVKSWKCHAHDVWHARNLKHGDVLLEKSFLEQGRGTRACCIRTKTMLLAHLLLLLALVCRHHDKQDIRNPCRSRRHKDAMHTITTTTTTTTIVIRLSSSPRPPPSTSWPSSTLHHSIIISMIVNCLSSAFSSMQPSASPSSPSTSPSPSPSPSS